MRPKVVAIIQARMGSKRLPGKVLMDIGGEPMIARVVERVRSARQVDETVVATSTAPQDDPLAAYCHAHGIPCVRGSENDVLGRFLEAARAHRAETVVRLTADCPLMDGAVIDRVVLAHAASGADYTANCLSYTYPDGLDVEVFSVSALGRSAAEATLPSEREHVTAHLRRSGLFKLAPNVTSGLDIQGESYRWTVDEPRDIDFVRAIYDRLAPDTMFGFEQVLRILKEEPALQSINQGIAANEGYYTAIIQDPPVKPTTRKLDRSVALKAQADRIIPSATQTFSKGYTQYVGGVAPIFVQRGKGSHVWDVDGNEYIDYSMGLGPVILGHADPTVNAAVAAQMEEGVAFPLPHPLEIEVSQLLIDLYPGAEMVRFGKNGSDATAGAVRAARAFTGRDVVACSGYHGWQDWYIGTTSRNRGVPQAVRDLTKTFRYNDIESLERVFLDNPGKVAAVVMEPYSSVMPVDGFLAKVRALCDRERAVLIFDEIVTGFRLAMGGAAEYFGVKPDLACLGKAIANGLPLSAVVGRRDIMMVFDEIFYSFTFGGEAASLAAAKATLTKMQRENVIRHLWDQGSKLKTGYNFMAKHYGVDRFTQCIGLDPRTVITFKDEMGADSLLYKSYFQQECLKRGILFGGGQNLSASHSEADVTQTLRAYRASLELLGEAIKAGDVDKRLEGEVLKPVFRVR